MNDEIVGGEAEGWRSTLARMIIGPVETAATQGHEQECDGFDRAVSGEAATDVLPAFLACARDVPDELTLSVAVMVFPAVEAVPPHLRHRFTCHVRVSYCGTPGEGDALIRPQRMAAPLLLDTVRVCRSPTWAASITTRPLPWRP
jgi:hypothetical protein